MYHNGVRCTQTTFANDCMQWTPSDHVAAPSLIACISKCKKAPPFGDAFLESIGLEPTTFHTSSGCSPS